MIRAPLIAKSAMRLSRSSRLFVASLVIVVGAVLVAYAATRQAERYALREAGALSEEQLHLYARNLQTLIDRYRSLPAVLALDPEMSQSLAGPLSTEAQHRLNLKLEQLNRAAGSSTLELLDRTGLAVAASNWRLPTSYVGHNYGFRPYFLQTRTRGAGRFYAVGVTTGIPGYFLSQAVTADDGTFLGAIVVKLEFPELEHSWSQQPDIILVSDARGIVFIANQPGWRYRILESLRPDDHAELEETRQYNRQPLLPLTYQPMNTLAQNQRLTRVHGPLGVQDFLWTSLPLTEEGWTLHLLRDRSRLPATAQTTGLAAAGAWFALVFALLFLQQRRRLARERQRSRDELERLVEARTADLRTAQDGLIQAAKLAALGQMSAALAHELNQPLTAQRMQLASVRLLLDQQRHDEARQSLARIDELLGRMAALTGHLKTYARKTPAGLREPLDLACVVDKSFELLAPRVQNERIDVSLRMSRPAKVRGDAIRLEQVLVNLLRNALDAMADKSIRQLDIALTPERGRWLLCVTDSGGGIAEEHLSQVFDPFFTTKPVGEGLGLGLAVSYAIVHELGGELTVDNTAQGARFMLTLPMVIEEDPT
ncbi:ATP-binding protein [Pseudomonas luteola]|uniref:sensor histidine kinase n=1 Tax=Pseudomonas luteola TaxID=47886 RepID=UPI003A872219